MKDMSPKKNDREKDVKAIQQTVSDHMPWLTAAALSAAIGSICVMELSVSDTGKTKYTLCKSTEQVIKALEWISEYGNSMIPNETGSGYFILQQKAPDAKFWDALTVRQLGRVPEEAKITMEGKIDFVALGKRAAERNLTQAKSVTDPIPSSWST